MRATSIALLLLLVSSHTSSATSPDPLTGEEIQWVREHPVVRYTGEPNWPPLEFVEDGNYSGIASGYLKLLSSTTGLRFEFVPSVNWDEAMDKARNGEVDLLPCLGETPERRKFIRFTRPYLSFPLIIITRKDSGFVSGLRDLTGKQVAVPRGFYSHERLAAEHPEIPLVTTNGELEALRAVASGQAEAFVGNVAIASYLIDKYGLANLKVAAPTEFENSELCMGIRADLPMLQQIIQKGLDGLPAKDQDSVRQRWISVRYEYGLDPRDLWRGITAAILILGPVAIASYYYTRRLQKQIRRRQATEARLAVKSSLLETTLEHMAQGILMADEDGTVLAHNHHYQDFFGYSDAFLAARPNVAQIFEDYWRPRGMDEEGIAGVIADSKRRDFFKYELPLRDDCVLEVMHSPTPNGGFVRTYTDITDRKRAEEETQRLAEAAQAASRAKGAFLANMSHEIRTPLNAIIGFGQLLQRSEDLAPKHREEISIMTASGQHLLRLINDVLDMSKLEAGRTELHPVEFDLPTLISDTANMFRLRTQEKQLFLACHLDDSIPRYARTDDGKLRQILINLIGNAVKFTQQGSVTVRATATLLASGAKARLRVEVEDTGPGISPEEAQLLFQAFSQTSAGVKTQGGTGLGLAISREFARLMGGDISVHSTPGLGATFVLEIVFECPAADNIETTAVPSRCAELLHLPQSARSQLIDAAESADLAALLDLADALATADPASAELIRTAANDFAYDEIVAMASPAQEGSSP